MSISSYSAHGLVRATVTLAFVGLLLFGLECCIPTNNSSGKFDLTPSPSSTPTAVAPGLITRPFCTVFPSPRRGRAAMCEDFTSLPDDTLPQGWIGQNFGVRSHDGRRVIVPLSGAEGLYVRATTLRAQGDYTFDTMIRFGSTRANRRCELYISQIALNIRTGGGGPTRVTLNQTESGDLLDLTGQRIHLAVRREGSTYQVLVNERQVLSTLAGPLAPVDGVTMSCVGATDIEVLGLRVEGAPPSESTGAETVVAAGPTSPPASFPPQALAGAASRTGVLQLAVANELCALLGDHTVHCVGLDGSGGARAVQSIGVVTRLVGRESTLCATDTSSHHRCWGQFSGWGGSDVPDGEQPQTLIAVGGDVIPPAEGVNGLGAWPLILTPQGEVRTTGFVGMSDPTSRPEVFPGRVAEADQNPDTVCARLTDGTVYCARGNHPVHVTSIEGARELRLGWDHGCARDEFGRVRCWEICRYGEVEGIGTRACRIFQHLQQRATLRSTEIRLGSPAQGLAELGSTFCALLDTGSVRCWRFGARGAIEMGSRIDGFAHARFLVGFGAEVCAVMEDGTVRCARIDGSSRLQRTVSFGS